MIMVGVSREIGSNGSHVHTVSRIRLSGNAVLSPPLANRSSHSSTSRLVRPLIACVAGISASGEQWRCQVSMNTAHIHAPAYLPLQVDQNMRVFSLRPPRFS